MLQIYGSPLSSPTNKVRYVANFLGIPFEFHSINLTVGEHRQPEFLKINPLGKIPVINDAGFTLGESNAIIRYLADKQQNSIYPRDLKQRALVDQWLDEVSQHVHLSIRKILFNTHIYKIRKITADERALQEGRQELARELVLVEQQLANSPNLAAEHITLADIALLSALDASELVKLELSIYPYLNAWRNRLMQESFYKDCHVNYTVGFQELLARATQASS